MRRTLRNRLSFSLLGVAAAAAFGLTLAGPATAAHAASDGARDLPHETAQQPNQYYCGPAAVRNALTVFGQKASMDQLATELGTTKDGTNSAVEITRVLNAHLGKDRYRTVEINNQRPTEAQVSTLRSDVMRSIDRGDPVVVNIAGTVTDTAGERHSFPGGHYLIVVGYDSQGDQVHMADSADPDGSPEYTLKVGDLANWIASRGYAA